MGAARHVLERLEEEVERCRRGGAPLVVVLGELDTPPGLAPGEADRLAGWMAGFIAGGKRRCDVAGHYGRRGFLMLLPQTTTEEAMGACRRLRQVLADRRTGPAEASMRAWGWRRGGGRHGAGAAAPRRGTLAASARTGRGRGGGVKARR